MRKSSFTCIAFFLFLVHAEATIHTINASGTSFSPNTLNVFVGDTLRWVRISGSHTTTSTTIPAGAAAWDSPLNSVSPQFDYIVSVAGVYNYLCTPHAAFGMTGTFTASYDCNSLNCSDSDACTTDSCTAQSGCINNPVVCDDGNNCTTDACGAKEGCTFSPIICDDSDSCTLDDCVSGACLFTPITGCNVGISTAHSLITLRMFPHPVQDKLTLISEKMVLTEIIITDFSGKQVYHSGALNTRHHTAFLPPLPTGVYLLYVSTDAGKTVEKLYVE